MYLKYSVLTSLHGLDLFAFSETCLTSSIFNESILLPGYSSPLRKDRIGKHGGGVALYVRDNIVVKKHVDLEPSNQLGNFKHNLLAYFGVLSCYPLHYVGNRFDSVNHSRFRCNNSTLNHDLFIRNCVVSLVCPHCNAPVDFKHYFLYYPMYATHHIALFTSAAHILGEKWPLASDKKKIEYFLFGSPDLHFQSNVRLFEQVQSFISHSSRFS